LISGIYEVLVNRAGGEIMQKNLELLGPINYTAEETYFGKKIQEVTDKEQVGMDSAIKPLEPTKEHPGGGSTDVGDVSYHGTKRYPLAFLGSGRLWRYEYWT